MTRFFLMAATAFVTLSAPGHAQNWSSNAPQIGPVNQPEGVLLHPYPARENYCPYGLEPITVGGVICCGTANTSEPYVNRAGRSAYRHSSCPPGAKGCS